MPQFSAWSATRLADYTQCPLKARLKHLDKIPEPPSPAMARGRAVHDVAANYLLHAAPGAEPPEELRQHLGLVVNLRQVPSYLMAVEKQLAYDADWRPCGWFDRRCAVRVAIDCMYLDERTNTVHIIDWKTGKFRPGDTETYEQQLNLYALAVLLLGVAPRVTAKLVYLDEGVTYPDDRYSLSWGRAQIPEMQEVWECRTDAMLSDRTFAPRANRFCAWCHYRRDNAANGGGQCPL